MNMIRKPRQPARPAVGAQREGDRAGHPVRPLPGLRLPRSRARPGIEDQRALALAGVDLARAAGSPRWWRARTARTRSAATTPARPSTRAPAIGAETVGADDAGQRDPGVGLDQREVGRDAAAVRRRRASRRTPWTRRGTPSAAGNSHRESVATAVASTQQRNARTAIVAPIAQRRPWLKRSRNGPISGATIANGSIVSPRKSATWPRASPVGTWKNRVPASEIATAASPAALKACSSISRDRPESPAPSARAARRACCTVKRPARPVARAGARSTPRPSRGRRPRIPRPGAGRGGARPVPSAAGLGGRWSWANPAVWVVRRATQQAPGGQVRPDRTPVGLP